MKETLRAYDEVIEQCRELFVAKLKDYGAAWRILRLPSLTDQIFIKAQRIRSLQENATRKVDEGERSEFIGIVNYSAMALIQIEKGVVDMPDLSPSEAIALYDLPYWTYAGTYGGKKPRLWGGLAGYARELTHRPDPPETSAGEANRK